MRSTRGNFIRAMHYVLQGADRRSTLNTEYSFNLHVDNAKCSGSAATVSAAPTPWRAPTVAIIAGGYRAQRPDRISHSPKSASAPAVRGGRRRRPGARSSATACPKPLPRDRPPVLAPSPVRVTQNFSNAPLQDSTGERRCHCSAGLVGAVLLGDESPPRQRPGATPGSRPRVITLSAHSKGRGGWLFGLQTSKV